MNGRRKRTLSGWLQQVRQFYNNAPGDSAILEKMAAYNITHEKLAAGKALADEVEAANALTIAFFL